MIEANELRLGNWVKGGTYQKTDFGVLLNIELFHPIPLIPEILEKAGFVLVPNKDSIYRKEQLQLFHGFVSTMCYTRYDAEQYCYLGVTIQYLHQLQNLYLALTGTELQIEL